MKAPRSFISSALWCFASSIPIGIPCNSASKYSRTISMSSSGSFPDPVRPTLPLAVFSARPFSLSRSTSSAGNFSNASLRASGVVPSNSSAYQLICCGGTFAVLMMRILGSTSHRAMKRRCPGFVGSINLKGETRCWLRTSSARALPGAYVLTRHWGRQANGQDAFGRCRSSGDRENCPLQGWYRKRFPSNGNCPDRHYNCPYR